jgi:hypothetical protein
VPVNSNMSLALTFLVLSSSQHNITVPIAPPFTIGSKTENSFTTFDIGGSTNGRQRDRSGLTGITFDSCFSSMITRKSIRLDRNGNRVYLVMVPKKSRVRTQIELTTNLSDRSLICKPVDENSSEMDRFSLLMRQPLFPGTKSASKWKTTLPNPDQSDLPIQVHCSTTTLSGDIILKQIVDSVELDNVKNYIEVTMRFDGKTGKLKNVFEWIEHGGKDDFNPATAYQEVF